MFDKFDKLKTAASDVVSSGKEKLLSEAEASVGQFLSELHSLQPFLAKANVKFGGYRLVIAVPPRFEIFDDPDMNWDFELDESIFDGFKLSIYQQSIVSSLKQISKFSKLVKSNGFDIGKVDFDLGIPPSITIEITPRDLSLSASLGLRGAHVTSTGGETG
jgi:hypothetical protein